MEPQQTPYKKYIESKKQVETKIKFGFGQLFHPTPETAKLAFRGVLYFAAIVVFLVDTVTEIPEPIKQAVRHYSLYAVAFVHFLSKMFGVQVESI